MSTPEPMANTGDVSTAIEAALDAYATALDAYEAALQTAIDAAQANPEPHTHRRTARCRAAGRCSRPR